MFDQKNKKRFSDSGEIAYSWAVSLLIMAILSAGLVQQVSHLLMARKVAAVKAQIETLASVLSRDYEINCPMGPTNCPKSVWPTGWNTIQQQGVLPPSANLISDYDHVSPINLDILSSESWNLTVSLQSGIGQALAKAEPMATYQNGTLIMPAMAFKMGSGNNWGVFGAMGPGILPPGV